MDYAAIGMGLTAIGAGIAVGAAGIGTGMGQGTAVSGAVQAMARNPEMKDEIRTNMFIGVGASESAAIYGLIISGALIAMMITQFK